MRRGIIVVGKAINKREIASVTRAFDWDEYQTQHFLFQYKLHVNSLYFQGEIVMFVNCMMIE